MKAEWQPSTGKLCKLNEMCDYSIHKRRLSADSHYRESGEKGNGVITGVLIRTAAKLSFEIEFILGRHRGQRSSKRKQLLRTGGNGDMYRVVVWSMAVKASHTTDVKQTSMSRASLDPPQRGP